MASVQGLNGLTIGHLAEALNMSKGGICAHFPSKVVLQLTTVERAAEIFKRVVVAPIYEKAPGLPRLQALSAAWFDYLDGGTFEGGCFFTNAVLELDDLESNEVRAAVMAQYNSFIKLVEDLVRQAIAAGHFRADLNVALFAFEFVGHQLATLVWRGLGRGTGKDRLALPQMAVAELFRRASL